MSSLLFVTTLGPHENADTVCNRSLLATSSESRVNMVSSRPQHIQPHRHRFGWPVPTVAANGSDVLAKTRVLSHSSNTPCVAVFRLAPSPVTVSRADNCNSTALCAPRDGA